MFFCSEERPIVNVGGLTLLTHACKKTGIPLVMIFGHSGAHYQIVRMAQMQRTHFPVELREVLRRLNAKIILRGCENWHFVSILCEEVASYTVRLSIKSKMRYITVDN